MKLKELIESAIEYAKFRGHTMQMIERYSTKDTYYYKCINCNCSMVITNKPLPNDCEIVGDAVAIHCSKDGIKKTLQINHPADHYNSINITDYIITDIDITIAYRYDSESGLARCYINGRGLWIFIECGFYSYKLGIAL